MRGELGSVYIHSKGAFDDRALVRHRATIVKLSGGIKSESSICFTTTAWSTPKNIFEATATGQEVS